MKPKSDNLFHFTRSLDTLLSILQNGFYPKCCMEDIEWFDLPNDVQMAFPMCCFCDIPLSRLSEHTDYYGNYGVGLTKDWGIRNKLNPVVYTPPNGQIQSLMKHLYERLLDDISDGTQFDIRRDELSNESYKLWSLIKPVTGKMYGSDTVKEFYQENEWRYVPNVEVLLTETQFIENRDRLDKILQKMRLVFLPDDIRYIFVKNDDDIPTIIDHINENIHTFKHPDDLKILQSRIISLTTLQRDI